MAETIGQQLKHAREAQKLTIEKVVETTRLRAHIIEAIEDDDFESLPSPVQARAFVRIYAEFLGFPLNVPTARPSAGPEEPPATLDQSPEAGKKPVQPTTAAVGSTGEPTTAKAPIIQEKIRELLVRIKWIKPRSKTPPAPVESTPSSPAEPVEAKNDEPVLPVPVQQVQMNGDKELALPGEAPSASSGEQGSQTIFANIGDTLRQHRESLSLTLDEIEHHTRVRKHYLQALEAGEFDRLPSSVQTRGMLNNYAHFLDMDVDALLLQFAEGLQTQRLERQPKPLEKPLTKTPAKTSLPSTLRRYLSMDTLVGGGLILVLIVFAIWGTSRVVGLRSVSTPQPIAPSISNMLAATPGAVTVTLLPANQAGTQVIIPTPSDTAVATIQAAGQGAVHVVVVAQESALVYVTVDGKKQFEGRVTPGKVYSYDGNTQIEVLTGNGAAVSILYNQSDMGPMGTFGEVVDRIYTANAILSPTVTFTPSPTITPKPSITPRPSPTLRPSLTPRRSPTP